jgi:23S rRNA A1618 N6-methylase RlmF
MEIFQEKYNKHFPLKKSKTTKIRLNKSPWITQGIVKSSRTKNKLYKRFIKYPNKKHETKYKLYKNKLNHIIRIAKKNYFSKRVEESKHNMKDMGVINKLIRKKRNKPQLPTSFLQLPTSFLHKGKYINNPNKIADNFNDHFCNIGPNLSKKYFYKL